MHPKQLEGMNTPRKRRDQMISRSRPSKRRQRPEIPRSPLISGPLTYEQRLHVMVVVKSESQARPGQRPAGVIALSISSLPIMAAPCSTSTSHKGPAQ